jgi:seryl-tRNA synthetase
MSLDELVQSGEIQHVGAGRLVLQGRPLAVLRWIDAGLEAMAAKAGAAAIHLPALIDREILERAEYFEAFGESATRVDASMSQEHCLVPALCYHLYARLAGRRLESPLLVTTVGRCYRNEPAAVSSLTRLWEFTMREVIFIGTETWVTDERRRWVTRVTEFATSIGLAGALEVATDPFFAGPSRGRKLIQQLKELKYELRADVGPTEPGVAIASMNLHEAFFGSRFGLTTGDGCTASSGCVAFGLERWTLALIAQLGVERAASLVSGRSA